MLVNMMLTASQEPEVCRKRDEGRDRKFNRQMLNIFLADLINVWERVNVKKKIHGLSPRANYTDRATAACRRSDCQLLWIEDATWTA
jgi:hypothetical protein